jgi:adenylate kinase
MQHAYEALLLIGIPGSGKSTQGKILGLLSGIHYWEAGEALRAVDPDTSMGRVIHQQISRGELVSDEIVVSICLDELKAHVASGAYDPATDLLLLDGIPRTIRQAILLDEHVAVMKILYLFCADIGQVVRRLRRRAGEEDRADDANECIIRHRLEVYQQATAQLLEYYPSERIVRIDALRSPVEVLDQILHALIPLLNSRQAKSTPA